MSKPLEALLVIVGLVEVLLTQFFLDVVVILLQVEQCLHVIDQFDDFAEVDALSVKRQSNEIQLRHFAKAATSFVTAATVSFSSAMSIPQKKGPAQSAFCHRRLNQGFLTLYLRDLALQGEGDEVKLGSSVNHLDQR